MPTEERKMTVGILIPTLNAARLIESCVGPLVRSSLNPRILIIDSSSDDDTIEMVRHLNVKVITIPRDEFNHGAVREYGRRILGTDIIVMMTQDAIPKSERLLESLTRPLLRGEASVTYARQIPRKGADILEAFPREYNYPSWSHTRDMTMVDKFGVYTFFCSDTCAAYLNTALDEVGGFPPLLTHEDYFVTAKLLLRGHKIAYIAEAVVQHSHRYTLKQEFQRYFDAGYVRAENPWMQTIVGQAEKRGLGLMSSLIRRVLREKPLLIPYVFATAAAKWLGFRVGFLSLGGPLWWKRLCSSQKFYWTSSPDALISRVGPPEERTNGVPGGVE
jgi:rhamnosyltransferase